MLLKLALGVILAAAALALFARDLRRALRDPQRRPATLFVAAAVAVLLLATLGPRRPPSPWWLAVPAAVLAWEAVRGWRRTPRSRLWEAGMASFAAALVAAAAALASGRDELLLVLAGAAGASGCALLWASWRREPRPWRADDRTRYERRAQARAGEEPPG
ncbi:MAG TPA: hypothetical protein VF211_07500 [Burkholderiales bacterium]